MFNVVKAALAASSLTALDVSNNLLDDTGCGPLASLLSSHSKPSSLKKLTLSGNKLTEAGFTAVTSVGYWQWRCLRVCMPARLCCSGDVATMACCTPWVVALRSGRGVHSWTDGVGGNTTSGGSGSSS